MSSAVPRLVVRVVAKDEWVRVRSAASQALRIMLRRSPATAQTALDAVMCAVGQYSATSTAVAFQSPDTPASAAIVQANSTALPAGVDLDSERRLFLGEPPFDSKAVEDRVLAFLSRFAISATATTQSQVLSSTTPTTAAASAAIISTTTSVWRDGVLPFVLERVMEHPDDSLAVRAASKLMPRLAQPDCLPALADALLHVLRCQPALQDSDLEADAPPAVVRVLLFQRLSPLLLLRMLPSSAFRLPPPLGLAVHPGPAETAGDAAAADADGKHASVYQQNLGSGAQLFTLLLDRIWRLLEFDDVRKVAAELIGRFPSQCVVLCLVNEIRRALALPEAAAATLADEKVEESAVRCKMAVFAMCCCLSLDCAGPGFLPTQATEWTSLEINASSMLEMIEHILAFNNSSAPEVIKLQHGCIDLAGLLVALDARRRQAVANEPNASDWLWTVTSAPSVRPLEWCLAHLQQRQMPQQPQQQADNASAQTKTSMSTPFLLCMANVLIAAGQHCERLPLCSPALPCIFHTAAQPLVDLVQTHTAPSRLRCAAANVLFTLVYRLRPTEGSNTTASSLSGPDERLLLSACTTCLQDASMDDEHGAALPRKMAGLKLLGALIAAGPPGDQNGE